MKKKSISAVLLCAAALAGCKGGGAASGSTAEVTETALTDIHETPETVVNAYFDAVFGGDIDALMLCCDPEDPDLDIEAMRAGSTAFYGSEEYKQWLQTTTRPVIMDIEYSDDFSLADVIYEFESAGEPQTDNTTVHCRDGKWYMD